jgi:cystinosin
VLLDAAARHDLSVITGNPAKLWIAALSIGYDLIFVAQHYWLYPDGPDHASSPPAAGSGASGSGAPPAGGVRGRVAAAPAAAPAQQPAAAFAFSELGRRRGKKQP